MSDVFTSRPARVAVPANPPKSTDRLLVWLVFLLVCVSIIATLPQTVAKLRYVSLAVPGGELGFRWLREGMFAVILTVTAVVVAVEHRGITRSTLLASFLIATWVAVVAFWSVVTHGTPLFTLAVGVRLLQYAPLVLVGYLLVQSGAYASIRLFASLLRWYVAAQAVVSAFQVLGGTRIDWYRTAFGYRAFGTFVSYNQFGATMAVCALVFCVAALWSKRHDERIRFDRWMLLSGFIATTSASRTAIVLTFFVVAYYYLATVRFGRALKLGLVTLAPLLLVAFYSVANEPIITGRETSAAIQNEKRVSIWGAQLGAFERPTDVLLGVGLGEGASAGVMRNRRAEDRKVDSNPHSAYISVAASFGLVGLLGWVGALGMTLRKAPRRLAAVFVITVGALGVPLGFLQVFPANALVFFLWGMLLGSWRYGSRSSRSKSSMALPLGRV